jgi:flagellar hook-length control protein FliK
LTDLLIISIPPAPATVTRALPRATLVHNGTPQANASPFQDALALELGLGLDGPLLPGLGVAAAAAKAGSSLKLGEDTAQAPIATDAPPGLASIGVPPLPPAFLPAGAERAGLAPDPRTDPFAKTSAAQQSELRLPFATAAADFAARGKFPPAAASEIAQTSVAQKSELHLPITSAAADFAVAGKIPPSAEGEIRSEVAFDTSLLDQHKTAPAQSAAIPTGGAAPAQVAQAPAAALEARVGERGWDQGLGDKLVWMAGQKQQVAELHLNPPDLGPLKITLTLNADQASAEFVSAHAPVREAIEAAMPRLREMLADSGITLGNASVSTDAFREQAQPQREARAYPAPPAAAAADPGTVTRGERLLRRSHGLVDTFV